VAGHPSSPQAAVLFYTLLVVGLIIAGRREAAPCGGQLHSDSGSSAAAAVSRSCTASEPGIRVVRAWSLSHTPARGRARRRGQVAAGPEAGEVAGLERDDERGEGVEPAEAAQAGDRLGPGTIEGEPGEASSGGCLLEEALDRGEVVGVGQLAGRVREGLALLRGGGEGLSRSDC
jgi:hypothetical protein